MLNKNIDFLFTHYIAHRGLHNNKLIENTIPAFKEAIKEKYPIELDIHLLKDKEIVVFHDDNLKRLVGIDKNIKDYTYQELLKENKLFKIPTLKEVLDLVNGKVPLIIELKYDNKVGTLEQEAVKLLDNYQGKFAVKSFNPYIVKWFRKNRPNYIRGLLIPAKKDFKSRLIRTPFARLISKPDFLSVSSNLDKKLLKKLSKKYKILIWTINNKNKYLKYKNKYNLIVENIGEIYEK